MNRDEEFLDSSMIRPRPGRRTLPNQCCRPNMARAIWLFHLLFVSASNNDYNNSHHYPVGSNVKAAISYYTDKVRASPDNPDFIRHLASALRFAGRFDECLEVGILSLYTTWESHQTK